MKKGRFTETQIVKALNEEQSGRKAYVYSFTSPRLRELQTNGIKNLSQLECQIQIDENNQDTIAP